MVNLSSKLFVILMFSIVTVLLGDFASVSICYMLIMVVTHILILFSQPIFSRVVPGRLVPKSKLL